MLNIVVPMAGRGTRFNGAENGTPKPLIEVLPGKRMVEYVIDYLTVPEPHRFIFVCLAEHARQFGLAAFFTGRSVHHELVLTEDVASGPAASVLLAEAFIDNRDELLIAYADCYVDFDATDFLDNARRLAADGSVVTYPSTGLMESYVELDGAGRVIRSAENVRISATASGSLYYFREGSTFAAAARQMNAADGKSGRESFVSPVFNELVAEGKVVVSYPITRAQRIEMGTPEDLERSRRWLAERNAHAL